VHRQHNTLAVFVEQQTMVVALMIVFGLTGTGVLFTALQRAGGRPGTRRRTRVAAWH